MIQSNQATFCFQFQKELTHEVVVIQMTHTHTHTDRVYLKINIKFVMISLSPNLCYETTK